MMYEVETPGWFEPGLSYGHRWRVLSDEGEVLISGWARGRKRRAVDAAKLAMAKLAKARTGQGTLIRRVILSNGHVGLPERA